MNVRKLVIQHLRQPGHAQAVEVRGGRVIEEKKYYDDHEEGLCGCPRITVIEAFTLDHLPDASNMVARRLS